MTNEELQKLAEEAEADYNAMKKRYEKTGYFTAESEEIARTMPEPIKERKEGE